MDQLSVKDARRGLLRGALYALALFAIVGVSGSIGYKVGRSSRGPAATAVAGANTREAMAKRNVVWRVWNGEGSRLPPSPERALGAALGMILSPEATVENRNTGMTMYLQKSVAYFSQREIREIQELMGTGEPARIADALRRIAAADGDAADLVRAVLADRARVERYVTGAGPIPLETMPDGSTP